MERLRHQQDKLAIVFSFSWGTRTRKFLYNLLSVEQSRPLYFPFYYCFYIVLLVRTREKRSFVLKQRGNEGTKKHKIINYHRNHAQVTRTWTTTTQVCFICHYNQDNDDDWETTRYEINGMSSLSLPLSILFYLLTL